jgi:hypothetical protein
LSDTPKDTHIPTDPLTHKPPREKVKKVSAIQGRTDVGQTGSGLENSPINIGIKASEFKPETVAALKRQGLDNPDEVLGDKSGKKAEATSLTVLQHEGLPTGNRERLALDNIIPGQYDEQGHGIDLIGITNEGRPIPIEIKKRQNPLNDSMGNDAVPLEKVEPETLTLRDDVLRERQVVPALRALNEGRKEGDPDQELSTDQMGGLWTRDRWLKLVKDDGHREKLAQAGVDEEYLNMENLKSAYSQQWRKILDGRTTVIVSTLKDDVTNRLKDQALFERGCNVVVIDLKSYEDATIHPNSKGPEHLPSPEREPISMKIPAKEAGGDGVLRDNEGKNKLEPPKDWRSSELESGG